jgi:hypothetical protein
MNAVLILSRKEEERHMAKKQVKKLTLQKETLERLDDRALGQLGARGALYRLVPSDSVPECCCSKASGCGPEQTG